MGKLIVFILLLPGCFVPPQRTYKGIDPELKYEVQLFESFYGQKISYPSVSFGDLPYPQVGVCTMYSNGNWEVIVDREYWLNTSRDSRIGLIFHELGHCVLKRMHSDEYIITPENYQVPKSLMFPYNFYDIEYAFMWSYYSKELFIPNIKYNKYIDIKIIN
jgi:hypothetical protein